MASKPGERRLQILQTLAQMLEVPKGEKITTAALAVGAAATWHLKAIGAWLLSAMATNFMARIAGPPTCTASACWSGPVGCFGAVSLQRGADAKPRFSLI